MSGLTIPAGCKISAHQSNSGTLRPDDSGVIRAMLVACFVVVFN